MDRRTAVFALVVISSLAAVLALAPMPWGYYALLRIMLCLTACVGFAAARKAEETTWMWVYGVIAVVYNPLLPVALGSKPLWAALNLATLIVLWSGVQRFRGTLARA